MMVRAPHVKIDRLREVVLLLAGFAGEDVERAGLFEAGRALPPDAVADDSALDWAERMICAALGTRVSRAAIVSLCGGDGIDAGNVVALLQEVNRDLSTSSDRFTATLENINQGVFMFDDEARLVVWNEKSRLLLNLPEGFLRVGISLGEMVRFNAERGEYGSVDVDSYVKRRVEGGKIPVKHRFERVRPNGVVLEIFGKPLPYGGFVSTFTDITDRKRAELALKNAYDELEHRIEKRTHELRESQERFRQMLDSSSDWYWETDADHRFTYVSDRYYNLTGLRTEEVIGYTRFELRGIKTETDAETNGGLLNLQYQLDGHLPFRNVDYVIRLENGDEMIVRTSGQPFFADSGEFLGYRGTATDATTIVAAQQELLRAEKLAALGGLVAGVAHEINTPVGIGLTAATYLEEKTRSFSGLLASGNLRKSDLEAFVETVSEISRSLSTNLRRAAMQVRSFKQVAVDQSSEAHRCFNLADYLGEILASLAPRLKRTTHSVQVDCPPDLTVSCNPGAISQILTNLIINSLIHGFEFREGGTVFIRVSTEGAALLLVYEDDGKGVPAANLRNIFQPFFTTKRGKGGSGLGLHIVYNLVTQSLGGRIEFGSVEGMGIRLSIQIPDIVCYKK